MCKCTVRPAPIRLGSALSCNSKVLIQRQASTASTASTSSASTVSQKKGVSFSPVVRVHVIERLDSLAARELFYTPFDFRQFRYEACQEQLEARMNQNGQSFPSVLKALFSGLYSNCQQARKAQAAQAPGHCCYCNDCFLDSCQQQAQAQQQANNCGQPASPEATLKELAFVM